MFDKLHSTAIGESLNIELILLLFERSHLRWFSHVSRISLEWLFKQTYYAEVSGKRPVGQP